MRRYNNHERSSTLVNTCTAKADELCHQINTCISMNEAVTHSSLTDVFYSFFELTAARSAASPCGNVLTVMSIMYCWAKVCSLYTYLRCCRLLHRYSHTIGLCARCTLHLVAHTQLNFKITETPSPLIAITLTLHCKLSQIVGWLSS